MVLALHDLIDSVTSSGFIGIMKQALDSQLFGTRRGKEEYERLGNYQFRFEVRHNPILRIASQCDPMRCGFPAEEAFRAQHSVRAAQAVSVRT